MFALPMDEGKSTDEIIGGAGMPLM